MKKISGSTFFLKKLFPIFWFGFLGYQFIDSILTGAFNNSIMSLIVPLVMLVFVFFLLKAIIWNLADEVYDNGDMLIFHKGNKKQEVRLKDIININYMQGSPERVILNVRENGEFGNELAFMLPYKFNPFSKNPIIKALIDRVDTAKTPNKS